MAFDLSDDYVDVAQRVREFRDKHPEGSLQQLNLQFLTFGGKDWCVYTAAAYRTPDDPRPGIGTAWEAVPGRTPFTRDSELQNAETAAWGRAVVAALAGDTRRIASSDEVRYRQADREQQSPEAPPAEMAQNAANGLPNAQNLDQVERVLAWATERNLLDLMVTDDLGTNVPLATVFDETTTRLKKAEDAA